MELRFLPIRWILDERGAHSVEFGLVIALFTLVAAFGFFVFGDVLTDFFVGVGSEFKNAAGKIPDG
jgi:Flp pilus assembly pilin Flp